MRASLKKVAMFIIVSAISSLSFAQMSGNYTIDKNSAASSTNFQSFTSAVQALRGVTRSDGGPSLGGGVSAAVNISVTASSGPYTEQISIPAITGASSSNTITFEGNNETIQYSATSGTRQIIHLNGADYIHLQNLVVKSTNSTYGWGIRLSNAANYNVIRGCDIDMTTPYTSYYYSNYDNIGGIIFSNVDDRSYGFYATYYYYGGGGVTGKNNKVVGNTIHGNQNNYGMYVAVSINGDYGTYDNTYNNEVDSNEIYGFRYYGVQTYFAGGNKIRNNNIHRVGSQSGSTYYFYAIYNYYGLMEMLNNSIHDPFPNGSNVTAYAYGAYHYYYNSPGGTKVVNNRIYNFNNGYGYYGLYMYYDGDVYHNSIDYRSPGTPNYAYGIMAYDYSSGTNIRVKNNSVSITAGNTKYPLYFNGGNAPNIDSDHNNIYRNSGNFGYFNGAVSTLTAWQNTSGLDANTSEVNPNYTSPTTGNLQPQVLELDGGGVPVGVTEDFNGNSRDLTNPDIGSYEFDIPINVTAINFPTGVCQGDVNDVEVTIHNTSTIDLSNFKVIYVINNVVQATEVYTSTLNAGASANFTFATQVTSSNLGNYSLEAYVRGKAPVASVNYTVSPSPIGSFISQGTPFVGAYNSGNSIDPDIVAYGDNVNYEIAPPTSYSNSDYGTTWTFDTWTISTPNGTAAGAQHMKTNPGAGNGVSSFTPVIGSSDSTFILSYSIRSLSNGCVAPEITREIFIAPRPVASFVALPVCQGQKLKFDNNTAISSGSVSYMWRFGDGDSSVLINPEHIYANPGTYNVELVAVSNYGYEDVIQGTAEVKENPSAEFSHVNTCEGAPMTFQDGSIIPVGTPTYTWDFGDGSAAGSGNAPTHSYASTGSYQVTMTVEANGCSSSASNYVTYAPRAVVDFSINQVSCNNEEVVFTNGSSVSSGKVGYSWDFETDGTSDASSINANHEYSGFGTFDITLTATTEFGCVDTKTKQVSLLEGPKADFTTSTLCNKDNVDFTNTTIEPSSGTTSYYWEMSDGFTSNNKDASKSFSAIGWYEVQLTATNNNGCQDIEKRMVSIDELPVAQFYATDVCLGEDVEFQNATTGNNGNVTYDWDLDQGMTSILMNPTATYSAAGAYSITLKASTPSGCINTITKTVNVNEIPTGTLSGVSGQKGDGTMVFTASNLTTNTNVTILFGDGGKYVGNTGANTSFSEVYTYTNDGVYFYKLKLEKAGCTAEDDGTIAVVRTDVNPVLSSELSVYPNPTTGQFSIDLSGLNEKVNMIKVYTADGKELSSLNYNSSLGSVVNMNLSNTSPGIYLIKIFTENEVYSSKLTLNK